MLKAHRHTISSHTSTWIGVAAVVVLAIALGAFIYSRVAAPALPIAVPEENPAPVATVAAPMPAVVVPAPAHSVSIYRSEETLQRWLDDAYEAHNATRVEMLRRILDGRYERRCHSLPY